jgi:hypothetical protein
MYCFAQINIDVTPCWRNNQDAAYQLSDYVTQVRFGIEVSLCLAWFASRKNDPKVCTAGVTHYAAILSTSIPAP